jgi:plasmid maintenance system killer protein|tara:strand:- start:138 stop:596 length:459 start_codon:yes stop_codon:yes gene_type:complete
VKSFWQNQKIQIFGCLIILSAFISGCDVNQLTSSNEENNGSLPQSVIPEISENIVNKAFESKEFEAFILQQMKILESRLSKKLESIDPADSQQIQQIVKQELVSFLKEKQDMKYQFLCDENERWIYRCNRMTGEIECFSMSSNKLRLLSSTR